MKRITQISNGYDASAAEGVKVYDIGFDVNGFVGKVRVYVDGDDNLEYDTPACLAIIEDDGDREFQQDELFELIADYLLVD